MITGATYGIAGSKVSRACVQWVSGLVVMEVGRWESWWWPWQQIQLIADPITEKEMVRAICKRLGLRFGPLIKQYVCWLPLQIGNNRQLNKEEAEYGFTHYNILRLRW